MYCLSACNLLLAIKMFISAIIMMNNMITFQGSDDWCYPSTFIDTFAVLSSLGWNFVILLDLVLIVCKLSNRFNNVNFDYKLIYNISLVKQVSYGKIRHQYTRHYHVCVWTFSVVMSLPPLISDSVGLSPAGVSCWVTGVYVWPFYATRYLFIAFSILGAVMLYVKLSKANINSNEAVPLEFVRVVSHAVMITVACTGSWLWLLVYIVLSWFSIFPPFVYDMFVFWLGGLGFLNSLIWYRFIKKMFETKKHSTVYIATEALNDFSEKQTLSADMISKTDTDDSNVLVFRDIESEN